MTFDWNNLTLSRSTSVINIPNSEHIHASDKYILSFISVRSFANEKGLRWALICLDVNLNRININPFLFGEWTYRNETQNILIRGMDVLWIRLPAPDVEQERVNHFLHFHLFEAVRSGLFSGKFSSWFCWWFNKSYFVVGSNSSNCSILSS